MTLEDLPLSMKRAVAMQASLMRCGIHAARLFVGPTTQRGTTVVAVLIKGAGKDSATKIAFTAGPWAGSDEEMYASWMEASALWNRTPQAERDTFWRAYKPNNTWLVQELFAAGLLPEPRMS